MPLTKEDIYEMLKFADTKDIGEVDMDDFLRVMKEAGLYGVDNIPVNM